MKDAIVSIDKALCTGCGRCREICPVGAIAGTSGQPHEIDLEKCIICGQCVQICSGYESALEEYAIDRATRLEQRGMLDTVQEPLFAAHYRGDVKKLLTALDDQETVTVVQCAPAVRVALGEEFGLAYGVLTPGKMATSLRKLGFDRVYDTNFAADLTIMEEGAELLARLERKEGLPMFTSCCPGWVKYLEDHRPNLLAHLSSCKSPQQMGGALFKTYGAKLAKVDPSCVYSVAIMPCTCKKYECDRDGMDSSGFRDVDLVITTRELAQLLKYKKIQFAGLADGEFDQPLGAYSGAGNIFGGTGGVMEAALRSCLELATGVPLASVELNYLRGGEGFRVAQVEHQGVQLKVGIVAGIQHVAPLLDTIQKGEADFHFIEVMCCPLGCVSGGGQPKTVLPRQRIHANQARKQALYAHDKGLEFRKSHENPQIQQLYKAFLGKPLGKKSHHLLHIDYRNAKNGGGVHE